MFAYWWHLALTFFKKYFNLFVMVLNDNRTTAYTNAAKMNKVVTRIDLQLPIGTHLGVNIASYKLCLQVPQRVPVLPVLQELILPQVSLP